MKKDIFILLAVIPIAAAAYFWLFCSMLWEALRNALKPRREKEPSCK